VSQKEFYLVKIGVSFIFGQTPRKTMAAIKSKNFAVSAEIGLWIMLQFGLLEYDVSLQCVIYNFN